MKFFCLLLTATLLSMPMVAPAQTSSPASSSATSAPTPAKKNKKRSVAKKKAVKAPEKPVEPVAEDLTVKAIEITGNKKIEKDAIAAKIMAKVGNAYSADTVREDVISLFKLGYFYDIEVNRKVEGKQVTLTYKVSEKPSITEINYDGNSEIKNEDLADATAIKPYQILNMAKVKEAVDKIQKLYEDKGYFLAKVTADVEDVKKDETVKLTFHINENEKVKVRKITFLGNEKIPDSQLKSKMAIQEGGFFSFISGSGQYKQEAFDRDTQIIRYVYYNQGYVQAKVDRPQVTVTPDKKSIYITIRVEEGEQYSVGEVEFAGDILFPKDELYSSIKIDKNGIFAYDVLQKDISDLTAKYGDLGYAYANVIPRTRFNDKERKVDLVFEFDKGTKVYFGKINVVGNTKTRDKVVRRELKISEGELYNETNRRKSLENVQRLGFFDEVNFKTSIDPDHTDIMNVDIAVKERNTGQIQLGAGYGTSQGFTLQGSVNQTNFLGRGENLGASMNLSSIGNYYSVSFTEPYFNDTLWSVGWDAYQSANTARIDYEEDHRGISMRLGHPITDYLRGFIRYKYDVTTLKARYDANGNLITDLALFPVDTDSGETESVTATLEYDTRNDRMQTTKGVFASASYEYAGWGSLKYTRASASFRFFYNAFWDVVWRNNLQAAQLSSLDGSPIPFSELYLLGGPYSLRGYQPYHVGRMRFSQFVYNQLVNPPAPGVPVSPATANQEAYRFYGGTEQAMYQTELQFPMVKEAGIMGVVFYDVGAADDTIEAANFYADVGIGIRWFSPIGPLRFEWGFPLNRNSYYQDASVFEFSIGTPF